MSERDQEPWAAICEREIALLFEDAVVCVDLFVEHELQPIGQNLMRATNMWVLAQDLMIAAQWGIARAQGDRDTRLVLESDRRMAHDFGRFGISPDALDLFINQTFGFLHDAMSRRHGAETAERLIHAAVQQFASARRAALDHLAAGPPVVRILSGPTGLMIAPALWTASSLMVGGGRREHERTKAEMSALVSRTLRPDTAASWSRRRPARIAFAGLLSIATATASATVGYQVADVASAYRQLLIEVEYLLAFGHLPDQGEEEPFRHGPGLVDVVRALDEWTADEAGS